MLLGDPSANTPGRMKVFFLSSTIPPRPSSVATVDAAISPPAVWLNCHPSVQFLYLTAVSYTHLRAHET